MEEKVNGFFVWWGLFLNGWVTFIIMRGQTIFPKTTTVGGHTQEHVPFGLNRGDHRESAPYVTSGTPWEHTHVNILLLPGSAAPT